MKVEKGPWISYIKASKESVWYSQNRFGTQCYQTHMHSYGAPLLEAFRMVLSPARLLRRLRQSPPLMLGWKYFLLAGLKGQAEPGPSPSTRQTSISSKWCKQKHIAKQPNGDADHKRRCKNRTKARIDTWFCSSFWLIYLERSYETTKLGPSCTLNARRSVTKVFLICLFHMLPWCLVLMLHVYGSGYP